MKHILFIFVLLFNSNISIAEEINPQSSIDEIIVTAEFNRVSSYNLSSSISIINEDDIFKRNANHLEELLFMTPNINYSTGSSRGKFIQIRGIGERSEFTEPVNYSVGVIIDGIDFTGIALGASTFDVKQIEVLRGPQGTLYGSNALAGLINIVSNDPVEDFYSELSGSLSEFGGRDLSAIVSGSNSQGFGYRFGLKNSQSDGYINNIYLNKDNTNNIDETIARGKLTKESNNLDLT